MKPTRARILIVEDDAKVRDRLASALGAQGYEVWAASSAQEARVAIKRSIDLLLLDLGLPDEDGLSLCRTLRREGCTTPILVVTARTATRQRVRGLDAGADDYVSKPFELEELLARIRSLLRRAGPESAPGRVEVQELWADSRVQQAGRGSEEVRLKPQEFLLLDFLLRNPDRVWTREQLLDRVWGVGIGVTTRTVDLHIRRLRALLETDPSDPQYIKTVWGVGYQLVAPAAGRTELG